MKVNELPFYDMSDNTTNCCPRFKPEGWDGQELHFDHKRFVKAESRSMLHFPLNLGRVFDRVQRKITEADAWNPENYVVLSHDPSPWKSEHYFAVDQEIEGEKMTELSGTYLSMVFEGPFRDAGKWSKELVKLAQNAGKEIKRVYFFYTTCPKCAKAYGKNYVVGFAEV